MQIDEQILNAAGCREEGLVAKDQPDGQTHRHEDEQAAEDRVETTDDFVDRQDRGQDVVAKDDSGPHPDFHAGHRAEELCRPQDEHDADEKQQDDCEDVHELLHDVAQLRSDDDRYGRTVLANAEHTREVVVNCAGEDAADDNPQHGDRAIESAEDRPENGAQTSDIEQLHEPDLGVGHGNEIHAVL